MLRASKAGFYIRMRLNATENQAFVKTLFTVAIPIILQHFVRSALNLVSGLIIGQLGDVPVAANLALAGAQPNPATSELTVAFTLPDPASPGARASARLEAFDLAGRRVASRDVGALGAGSHVVKLAEGAGLRCGVYVIHLTQGARTLTARAAIVR